MLTQHVPNHTDVDPVTHLLVGGRWPLVTEVERVGQTLEPRRLSRREATLTRTDDARLRDSHQGRQVSRRLGADTGRTQVHHRVPKPLRVLSLPLKLAPGGR